MHVGKKQCLPLAEAHSRVFGLHVAIELDAAMLVHS